MLDLSAQIWEKPGVERNEILCLVAIASMSVAFYAAVKPPAPVIVTAPAPAPKPTPRINLAPAGVYFLRAYVPVSTGKGIVGWSPGEQVTKISETLSPDGKFTVTDGQYSTTVAEYLLTNNLDEAAKLQGLDAARQSSLAASIANAQEYDAAREQDQAMDTAERINALNGTTPSAKKGKNPLDARPTSYRNVYKEREGHNTRMYVR